MTVQKVLRKNSHSEIFLNSVLLVFYQSPYVMSFLNELILQAFLKKKIFRHNNVVIKTEAVITIGATLRVKVKLKNWFDQTENVKK